MLDWKTEDEKKERKMYVIQVLFSPRKRTLLNYAVKRLFTFFNAGESDLTFLDEFFTQIPSPLSYFLIHPGG